MTLVPDKKKSSNFLTGSMFKQFTALYLTLIILFLLWVKFIYSYMHHVFIDDIYQDKIHDHESIVLMLKHLYTNNSNQELQVLIDKINATSNIPIKIIPIENLHLPQKFMEQLAANKPAMPFYPNDIHFEMITSELVAKIGPVGVKEEADFAYTIINYSPLVLFGALTLIWVFVLQYRLIRLETSMTNYSLGNFQSRATTGFWKLGNLNKTFNDLADRLERYINSQKHLTNAVSHELRSPISRLRFQLEMLQSVETPSSRQTYEQGMSDDLDDMDALIHELLNYATLESQDPISQWKSVELSHWLKVQQQHLYAEITNEIILDLPSHDMHVSLDPLLMARLLRNLVDNADKYTKDTIIIGATTTAEDCAIWVDDNGVGISPEDALLVFEPFSRLDSSRNKSTGGYGIGLAIVAQIARHHHGRVAVHQNRFGGARFIVSWPKKLSDK